MVYIANFPARLEHQLFMRCVRVIWKEKSISVFFFLSLKLINIYHVLFSGKLLLLFTYKVVKYRINGFF